MPVPDTQPGARADAVVTDRPRLLLTSLLILCLSYSSLQSAVLPALPVLQREFTTTPSWATWVVTGFTVVSVVATLVLGALADRVGYRRVLLPTLIVFGIATFAAALSTTIVQLLFWRSVQGVGGVVFPLAFAMAGRFLPSERVAPAIGLISAMYGVGSAVGFPLGGLLLETVGWPALFWSVGIVIVIGGVIAVVAIPIDLPSSTRARDRQGAVALSVALSLSLLTLTLPADLGWLSWGTGSLVSATGLAGWWLVHVERRAAAPILDLAMLRIPVVALSNAASFGVGFVMYTAFLLVVQYAGTPFGAPASVAARIDYGLGASPAVTGAMMVPAAAAIGLAGPLTGRLARRLEGPRQPLLGALLVAALGCGWLVAFNDTLLDLIVGMTIMAVGAGAALAAMPMAIVDHMPAARTSSALATHVVVRHFGVIIGAQLAAVVLTVQAVPGTDIPRQGAYLAMFALAAVVAVMSAVAAHRLRGATRRAARTPG